MNDFLNKQIESIDLEDIVIQFFSPDNHSIHTIMDEE